MVPSASAPRRSPSRPLLTAAIVVAAVLAFAWAGEATAAPVGATSGAALAALEAKDAAGDLFGATLLREIEETHVFLLSHRRGLPYTRDPRLLTPFSEVVRLQADPQALGYLNLYQLTGKSLYLAQAEERLDYILALGDSALAGSPLDGQVGYSFLVAHGLKANPRYLEAGLRIARRCLAYGRRVPNWDYAAALALGRAHALTGDPRFLEGARGITRHVAARQFGNGAFPHWDAPEWHENTHYTAWLLVEMLLHRRDDPGDPDMDLNLLRGTRFLAARVEPDGSVNYQDAAGSYYSNPGGSETRGWMHELAMLAFDLRAAGRRAEARSLLAFLFAHEMSGSSRGAYPDMWAYADPRDPWTQGAPSIIRTSLVFWFLTCIALQPDRPENGVARPCTISPDDCNAALRERDQCDSGLPGFDTWIDGIRTGCLKEDLIRFVRTPRCRMDLFCNYVPKEGGTEVTVCWWPGVLKCVGEACGDTCTDVDFVPGPLCVRQWQDGEVCAPRWAPAPAGAAPPARVAEEGAAFRLEGLRPNPVVHDFAVAFSLEREGPVRLELFDVAGRALLARPLGRLAAGPHLVPLGSATSLPAGVYLVRLSAGARTAIARAVIVR